MNPAIAGRPTLVTGTKLRLYPGMVRLGENVTLNVKNRSFSVTAELTLPEGGAAEGAIVAQGGRTGGWSFFAEDGKLGFHYNYCGLLRSTTISADVIGAGEHQVRAEFAYDGGGIGKGGTVTLFIDGAESGSGRVEHTHALYFSFDEGMDAGCDTGMPAYEGYKHWGGAFSATLDWAEVELGLDDHSHLIDPSEQLQAALRHQ